jgi:hypothetical protein
MLLWTSVIFCLWSLWWPIPLHRLDNCSICYVMLCYWEVLYLGFIVTSYAYIIYILLLFSFLSHCLPRLHCMWLSISVRHIVAKIGSMEFTNKLNWIEYGKLCKIYSFHGGDYDEYPSSGMWCRAALVGTDVSEDRIVSSITVTRIDELGTTLAVTNNVLRLLVTASLVTSSPILVTLMMEAICSSETEVLTRATRRHIPEGGILQYVKAPVPNYLSTAPWRRMGEWIYVV